MVEVVSLTVVDVVSWFAHFAAPLEDPGSDPHPELDALLSFFHLPHFINSLERKAAFTYFLSYQFVISDFQKIVLIPKLDIKVMDKKLEKFI